MADSMLVALGGNALLREGDAPSFERQAERLRSALAGVAELASRGHPLVITHGNGPQVGHALLRAAAARDAYELPLHACVAQSQGEIGWLVVRTLEALLRERRVHRAVACVLTQTVVSEDDPAMRAPSKPVGPFYTLEQTASLVDRGWALVKDAGRGWRRVLPSPRPLRIVEAPVIRALVEAGTVVVAAGGGGIPVRLSLEGVDAVIDKDHASTSLALALGVGTILMLTAVDSVKLDYRTPRERAIVAMTAGDARRWLAAGHFAPGSMGPKIEAAIDFLAGGGREVVVTTPELALEALAGRAGTRITGGPP
jgi:carbamate kinase